MKRILPFLIMVIVAVVALSGCQSNTLPTTLQIKIIGKWTMKTSTTSTSGTITGNTAGTYTANDYYDFKADGTINIMDTGVAHNGTWTINSNSKLIISGTGANYLDSFAAGFDLPVLTTNNLQMTNVSTLNGVTTTFTLNLAK